MNPWPEPVERVADVLRAAAVDARLEEFPEGTPTAAAAAEAVGCDRAQIVKSLVFVCDELPVLALVPGDRRADAEKVAAAASARYARVARPEEVVSATGFEPGAVAPFPAPGVSRVLMDRSLLLHELVWIGAGSPKHMAGIAPRDLARLARATIGDLAEA
ncbi:MAG TPA: YbaK/EbsC family protein [Gaiellaceae bacterium]|nr:YbaK/EbsC family protein [Gaiellaceae bacterium]